MTTGIITQQPIVQTNENGIDSTASNSNVSTDVELAGGSCDRGLLQSMRRQGFNKSKCMSELVANSIDAGASEIKTHISEDKIIITDNGRGMSRQKVRDFLRLYRSNHSSDRSMGVSGIGGKVATAILSEENEVTILTHQAGEEYLRIVVPWDVMFRDGRLDIARIQHMTEDQRVEFEGGLPVSGTRIEFPYNDELNEVMKQYHVMAQEHECFDTSNLNDVASVIFGSCNTNISYTHWLYPGDVTTLDKYDYFGGNNNEYYCGKTEYNVTQYEHPVTKVSRYIWGRNGKNYEINSVGNGKYSTKAKVMTTNLVGYEHVGEFTVTTGQRFDVSVFDPSNPLTEEELNCASRYKWETGSLHNAYDKAHIHPNLSEGGVFAWLSAFSFVRNDQQIGKFACPDFKPSSARGSARDYHKFFAVRAELKYSPVSDQNNRQDRKIGIQQCKSQWQDVDIDKNLSRLVKSIREEKAKEIWNYFIGLIPEPSAAEVAAKEVAAAEVAAKEVAAEEAAAEEAAAATFLNKKYGSLVSAVKAFAAVSVAATTQDGVQPPSEPVTPEPVSEPHALPQQCHEKIAQLRQLLEGAVNKLAQINPESQEATDTQAEIDAWDEELKHLEAADQAQYTPQTPSVSVSPEPVAHEPVAHEPVAHEPVTHEPVTHEPVAHEPVAHEPVTHEPVTHEPVSHEPVSPEPDPIPQASDVRSFRRGSVSGLEYQKELQRHLDNLDINKDYPDGLIGIYNLMRAHEF
jgi:hypothetical protein